MSTTVPSSFELNNKMLSPFWYFIIAFFNCKNRILKGYAWKRFEDLPDPAETRLLIAIKNGNTHLHGYMKKSYSAYFLDLAFSGCRRM